LPRYSFFMDRAPWAPDPRQGAIEKLKKQDFGRGTPSGDGPYPV